VRQILSDQPVDTRAARGVLGYDLNPRHLALTLWAEPGTADSASDCSASRSTCSKPKARSRQVSCSDTQRGLCRLR
jgi:hypothetical protein